MAAQRRFLVINLHVGTRRDGFIVGPLLVSTDDYQQFHYWDEPEVATLETGDYDIITLYPCGLTLEEAGRRFKREFLPPPTVLPPFMPGHDAHVYAIAAA